MSKLTSSHTTTETSEHTGATTTYYTNITTQRKHSTPKTLQMQMMQTRHTPVYTRQHHRHFSSVFLSVPCSPPSPFCSLSPPSLPLSSASLPLPLPSLLSPLSLVLHKPPFSCPSSGSLPSPGSACMTTPAHERLHSRLCMHACVGCVHACV